MLTPIDSIFIMSNDNEDLIMQKNNLLYISLLMSLGGFVWGSICLGFRLNLLSFIPFSYVLLTLVNFYQFYLSRNYYLTRYFQLLLSLIMPFVFQLTLGGFVASGAVVLWSIIPLLISVHLATIKERISWLILFLLIIILTGILDSNLNAIDERLQLLANKFFVFNISSIAVIFYLYSSKHIEFNKRALEKVESARLAKSEFLATVSHELRTPLNGIIGFTDLLSRTELNSKQHHYITTLKSSSYSLLHVINDILDFSKIQSGKITLNQEKTSLPHLIDHVMEIMTVQANAKKIELRLHIDENCPRFILTDPVKLKQILINLINNAIKFTEQGFVTLKIQADSLKEDYQTTLKFSVIDTGIGIHRENQKKIFEAFFQADSTSTKKFGGTGLGLTIASNLLALMNSEIVIESEIGKGSTFSFCITCKSSVLRGV